MGSAIAMDLRYALDRAAWAEEVHGLQLDGWQREVVRSQAKRLAMCCYRQAGKTTATKIVCAHDLLFERPGGEPPFVGVIAPARRQSDELEAKILGLVPDLAIRRRDDERGVEFANGARLLVVPANPDAIRGFAGVTRLVFEEAAYIPDEVYATAAPYVSTRNGADWRLSTAGGKRGAFWRAMHDSKFERHLIPWTPGGRVSAEFVADYRREHGDMMYRQEYLCEFLAPDSAVVQTDLVASSVDGRFRGLDV